MTQSTFTWTQNRLPGDHSQKRLQTTLDVAENYGLSPSFRPKASRSPYLETGSQNGEKIRLSIRGNDRYSLVCFTIADTVLADALLHQALKAGDVSDVRFSGSRRYPNVAYVLEKETENRLEDKKEQAKFPDHYTRLSQIDYNTLRTFNGQLSDKLKKFGENFKDIDDDYVQKHKGIYLSLWKEDLDLILADSPEESLCFVPQPDPDSNDATWTNNAETLTAAAAAVLVPSIIQELQHRLEKEQNWKLAWLQDAADRKNSPSQ